MTSRETVAGEVAAEVAACATTTELSALHGRLRAAGGIDEGELWTLVQARWDEISATARPNARRARTQRPRKPSWVK